MPGVLEILRRANDNLSSALVRLRPEHKHCSTLQPQDLSDLLSHVLAATECLRNLHSHSASTVGLEKAPIKKEAIEKEVAEEEAIEKAALAYRVHLENLKRFLPDLHVRLHAERARLETARTHLAAASAWAGARKEIL
jgi:hypothetical protein